jgi:hypothetical protein
MVMIKGSIKTAIRKVVAMPSTIPVIRNTKYARPRGNDTNR